MALTSFNSSSLTKKRKQLIGGVAAVVVIFLAVISPVALVLGWMFDGEG